jgi:CoA:oxalate CoA-transferase
MTAQALEGVRILDLTEGISGPYCTRYLACFGADVLKVEAPAGDPSRRYGPFPGDRPDPEASGTFLYLNTSKRGVTLDITSPAGREIIRRLAADVDVLVEDRTPGAMADLGLGYDELLALNPRLVYVSITSFGQTGPWSHWKADELIIYAASGLMSLTGDPQSYPLKPGGQQCLHNAGLNAFTGTLMALYAQQISGKGQHVDVSAYESSAFMMEPPRTVEASVKGESRERVGNLGTLLPAMDGHVNVIRGPNKTMETLAEMMGVPELADEKYAGLQALTVHADELEALMLPWLTEHTKEEFYHVGQERGQLFGYCANPRELLESPHLREREFFVEIEHPVAGRLPYPGAPYKMSETPWRASRAPLLGEHNEDVYCGQLRYSKADLVNLRRSGVI